MIQTKTKLYRYVLASHTWLSILDYDHRSTNPSTVTRGIDRLVVVIDVNPNKGIDTSSTTQFPKVCNKMNGEASEPDNCSIDVNDKSAMRVDLCSSRQTYV